MSYKDGAMNWTAWEVRKGKTVEDTGSEGKIWNQKVLSWLFQKTAEWNTPKLIPQGHQHLDTKPDEYHKKRKLQASITDEHRGKNPQQNINKPKSAVH